MAGSIGQVYYDVLPNLDGFAAKVASGVGSSAKPLKIKVDTDTGKAAAGLKGLGAATQGLDVHSRRLLSTQGTLRVAQARLNEVRQRAAAGSSRLISAEESYARAQRAVGNAQEVASAAAAKGQKNFGNLISTMDSPAVQGFGRGLAVAGAGIAVGMGLAVKTSADFEEAVSHVAATGQDAKASIGQLRSEAIRYGAATSFSAKEAANAQEELIKANVSVTDTINGGLSGALDLAAAGSLGVADAAGIMATTMSQFKVPGTEAAHVADLLAAGAGKAQGEVADFAGALKYVGPVAHSAGVGLDQTVGVIAELADQGVKGEQAGTSLRSMIVSLTSPIGVGAKAIEKYGINLRNSSGEFVGMEAAAGELQDKLGGLSGAQRDAALAAIFGKNSITAARIVYEGGAEGVQKWTNAVNDSGFAQDVARTKMDNLKGDVEKLGGAFQSAFIDTAAGSTGGLRSIVQAGTGLVDAYNEAPAGIKSTGFAVAGLAASALLGAGGIIKLGGVVSSAKSALDALSISAKTAGLAAGGIGIAIAVAGAVIGHFAIKNAEAAARQRDLTSALEASNGAIDSGIASMRARTLEESGALQSANKLGIASGDLALASLGNVDAQARVNKVLQEQGAIIHAAGGGVDEYGRSTNELEGDLVAVGKAIGSGNKELANAQASYRRQKAAVEAVSGSTKALGEGSSASLGDLLAVGDAISAVGDKSEIGAAGVKSMTDALYGQANAAAAAMDAELGYQQALDDAQAAAKANGETLNIHTQKGRDNIRALEGMAAASQKMITTNLQQGGSWKAAVRDTESARKSFIGVAKDMGATGPEARKMADELGLIPKDIKTKYQLAIQADQRQKLQDLETAISKLPKEQQTRIRALVDKGDLSGALRLVERLVAKKHVTKVGVSVDAKAGQRARAQVKYFDGTRKTKVAVNTSGVPKSKKDVGSIKGKPTTVKVNSSGVPKTQKQVSSVRHKGVTVGVRSAGVPRTQGQISGIKGKPVAVRVFAAGIGAVQSAINAIHGTAVNIIQHIIKKANGGPLVGRAGGGPVVGPGGPRDDLITGINRANSRAEYAFSNGEFITNAKQYAANKAQVEMINAGGKWDLTPRAGGGTVGPVAQTRTAAHRPLTLVVNVDLGPELGGIRRIVTDAIDDNGEFTATLGRMR